MQAAICACKQLRSLSIRRVLGKEHQQRESGLMQTLLSSLPELRALQLTQVNDAIICTIICLSRGLQQAPHTPGVTMLVIDQ